MPQIARMVKPGEPVRYTDYHSREWGQLVEQGWTTDTVGVLEPARTDCEDPDCDDPYHKRPSDWTGPR